MKTVYKNMKRKRVVAIPLIILWIILMGLLIFFYGYSNIKSNSVYYAKYTPHKEGVEPELMMLVDNLYWIYTPDIKGIKYKLDGGNSVHKINFKSKDESFFANDGDSEYFYSDSDDKSYVFNRHFKLIYAGIRHKKIDVNSVNVEEVKKEIYEMTQPVIDRQIKPTINLQWLFDMVYKDKFN